MSEVTDLHNTNAAMLAALGIADYADPDRPVIAATLELEPGKWPTLNVTRVHFADAGPVAEVVERFKLKPYHDEAGETA